MTQTECCGICPGECDVAAADRRYEAAMSFPEPCPCTNPKGHEKDCASAIAAGSYIYDPNDLTED